jgi:hypothetical protein
MEEQWRRKRLRADPAMETRKRLARHDCSQEQTNGKRNHGLERANPLYRG